MRISLLLCLLITCSTIVRADERQEARERAEQEFRAIDRQVSQMASTVRALDKRAAQDDSRIDDLTALVKRLGQRVERLQGQLGELQGERGTRQEAARRANREAEGRERLELRERKERERPELREKEEREQLELRERAEQEGANGGSLRAKRERREKAEQELLEKKEAERNSRRQ